MVDRRKGSDLCRLTQLHRPARRHPCLTSTYWTRIQASSPWWATCCS